VLWLAQIMQEKPSAAVTNDRVESKSVIENSVPRIAGLNTQISSTDITDKIQHQSEIDSKQAWSVIEDLEQKLQVEQAWTMIKELEKKLQSQIQISAAIEKKLTRSEHRAIIAEQRLQMVHEYLHKMGVNPQDVYGVKQNIRN
jgi:ATP-dependent Lon protease